MSSSWKEEDSQTTVASASSSPTSEETGVPTLPATATGSPASRWTWPIHSVVVVLPFVPVTAMNSFGSSRQASSSSPTTASPRARAARDDGARVRHAGALDERPDAVEQLVARVIQMHFDARCAKPADVGRAGVDADHLLPARPQRERRRDARSGASPTTR